MGLRVELLDRAGMPSLGPAKLRVVASRAGVTPAETTITSQDGVGWAYFRLSKSARASSAALARVSMRDGASLTTSVTFPKRAAKTSAWSGWAIREPERGRLREALGTREPSPRWSWINRDGFVALGDTLGLPALPGYRLWGFDSLPPRFVPIAGGALHGRRIMLDPDGGGEDAGGMGPSGTRGSFYNMQVAQALASLLRASGAEVALARNGDVAASDVERVRLSEVFQADRFLRIGHRPESTHVGYYFSSAPGKVWGQRTAAWLARFGFPAPPVVEDAQYPLQQTSCTALYVSARRVDASGDEEAMNAPGAVRAEASALYLGLLEDFAGSGTWPIDSVEVRDADDHPAVGALVTLGGALVLQADARGKVRFARTESGPLMVTVEHPAVSARAVLLDSTRGIRLTGPRGR